MLTYKCVLKVRFSVNVHELGIYTTFQVYLNPWNTDCSSVLQFRVDVIISNEEPTESILFH